MNHFEDFARDDLARIDGIGETLEGAYEDFAKKVAELVAEKKGLGSPHELPADYFDDKPIATYVKIIVQPHNQWVKAYWVKAY